MTNQESAFRFVLLADWQHYCLSILVHSAALEIRVYHKTRHSQEMVERGNESREEKEVVEENTTTCLSTTQGTLQSRNISLVFTS